MMTAPAGLNTDCALKVDHLGKSFGPATALADVSFAVPRGCCFGLLGPNGAGKSTTMKIVAGLLEPDVGSVNVLGLDATQNGRSVRRHVGYVPQDIALYPMLSVHDNLMFFGEVYGLRGARLYERIDAVLAKTGLSERRKDLVENLSGGMKRRINIAAALLHEPQLLILDEPTVGVDPHSRNHIFELVRELVQQGATVIYSTHYMEEAETLCDEVAILDHGRVVTSGPLVQLWNQYGAKAVYVQMDGFEQLPPFPHPCQVSRREHGWWIETEHRQQVMAFLLQQAEERGLTIHALEMARPSLESVFLKLTGTRLRD
ncbi:ABC transporter ATP-binding protein [Alicyclobacillus kakegawensis]|uniref:ABC transporter ATP-binding protein n=1 Tax=Alicyclobacillus kakegawensis TaxID=392012 RepID=UPI000A510537|nr:ABC transporter ATP-binding protein [Alicyclobacillus kakegawensis]